MNAETTSIAGPGAEEQRHRKIRRGILRSAILWTPLFVLCAGSLLFFFIDRAFLDANYGGTWFLVFVLVLFTALTGSQSIQAVVDLFGKPHRSTGVVTRRWSKLDSFVMRTHYVRIERTILRGDAALLDTIQKGDRVEATYYRHSGILVSIARLEGPASAPNEGGPGGEGEPGRRAAELEEEAARERRKARKVEF